MDTRHKDRIAHIKFEEACANLEIVVSKPTIETRYDYIIDIGNKLLPIQIKYCDSMSSRCKDAINIDFRRRGKGYTTSEIDVVVAYIPKIKNCVWLPASIFDGKPSVTLRLGFANSKSAKNVRYLNDFIWPRKESS